MLTGSLSAAAAALVCWPDPAVRRRLGQVLGAASGTRPRRSGARSWRRTGRGRPRWFGGALGCAGAMVVLHTAGPAAAVSVSFLVAAGHLHRRSRARSRAVVQACDEMSGAVRGIVAELRVGAHPQAAVESAAADADPEIAEVLRAAAASMRWEVAAQDRRVGTRSSRPVREAVTRLLVAWSLAAEHGIPLADVLEVVQRDLEATVRSVKRADARMAGPRASAGTLAVLPLAGIVLGEAMGASPLTVLASTGTGGVLLVAGTVLVLCGVAWSAALTGRVVPR